jgi:signal transduction histidine kinase
MDNQIKIPNKWLAYISDHSPETIKKIKSGERKDLRGVIDIEKQLIGVLEGFRNQLLEKRLDSDDKDSNNNDIDNHFAYKPTKKSKKRYKKDSKYHRFIQVSYIISHNIRSNLSTMNSLVQLIEGSITKESDENELINLLSECINNMNNIIEDLTKIIEITELRYAYEFIQFDSLLETTLSSLQFDLQYNAVKLTSDFQVSDFQAVKPYMVNIFYNLTNNAIKYNSPLRQAHLHIKTYLEEGKLCLEFIDNGQGIDLEKHKNQLFGLYKKLDFEKEGRGLGLYLVKTQVEEMRGSIEVKSTLGEGTTFTIKFPHK